MQAADNLTRFYPNLCSVYELKVGGNQANATNDFGTVSNEMRHFIDRDFLASTEGGEAKLASLVSPEPACRGLFGAKTPEPLPVLGMLAAPLSAIREYQDKDTLEVKRIELHLRDVLVVEELPVPLHVSFKALEETWPENVPNVLEIFNCNPGASTALSADAFPPMYRIRPYFLSGGIIVGGAFLGQQTRDEIASRLEATQDQTTAVLLRCAACGATDGLSRCRGCMETHYCSRECQRRHWREHKTLCRAARDASGEGETVASAHQQVQ